MGGLKRIIFRALLILFALWQFRPGYAPAQTETAPPPKTITNSLGMPLVRIEPGEFWMGSAIPPKEVVDWLKAEGVVSPLTDSRHKVRITKPFCMGKYEVTKGEFRTFVEATNYQTEPERDGNGGEGWNPVTEILEKGPRYTWQNPGWIPYDDTYPVVNVTWNDAQAFCKWLSKKERITYRLPSEAEWEYACRAGTETLFYNGDDPENVPKIANAPDGTAKEKFPAWPTTLKGHDGYIFAAPVGRFAANPWGLHDMLGNVGEWTADVYDANALRNRVGTTTVDPFVTSGPSPMRRVWRGGFFYYRSVYVNCAARFPAPPNFTADRHGFRVVYTPQP